MNYAIFLLFCNYLGTIAFAISGVLKGIRHRLDVLGLTLLAIITACGGGIIRDLLVNEIPIVLKEDIYAFLAFAVGIVYHILITELELPKINVTVILFGISLITRLIVIKYRINLPTIIRKSDN